VRRRIAFLVPLRCDSTSAAVTGSEPGDVIRNVVSSHTFSHNCVVKIGGWFQTTHFDQKKGYNEGKVCDKYKIWKTTFKLRRRHFLLNCRRGVCVVIAVSIITGGAATSWRRLQEIHYWSLWREKIRRFSLPLQNLLTASRQLHDSLSSCCYLLLVPINVLRHLGASISKYRCLRQLLNRPVPSIRLRSRFLSLAGHFVPIFISIFGRELLILRVQQLEDIYRIISMNLCAWLNP